MTTKRTERGFGDGDLCPDNPEHGLMYHMGASQWCPHVDHTKDVGRLTPRSTVEPTALPELNITLEV